MIRIAVLSACLFTSPAIAHDIHACRVPAKSLHTIVETTSDANARPSKWGEITGENAQKILATINAIPPETALVADHFVIALFPDASVAVFLVNADCVKLKIPFSGKTFRAILGAALTPGDPS